MKSVRAVGDEGPQTAGGDYVWRSTNFVNHSFQDAINQTDIAVIQTRLHCFDAGRTDDLPRTLNLDPRQFRRAFEQRICRNRDSRRDYTTKVLAFRIHRVERRGRAEIN